MALSIANVELTDTFNTWRVRTNSIIGTAVESANAQVSSSIVPTANVTYDLGTNELRFRDLYLSGNTIQLGAATLSSNGTGVAIAIGGTNIITGDSTGTQNASDIVATGNVTATFFIGDGSQLTNAGSTVATDGGANRDLSVVFTGITSGTMTTANVSSSLLFNPSTGRLTANTIKVGDLQDSSGRTLTIRDAANNIVWGG